MSEEDRVRRAAERLAELEESGATLDDILDGPEGLLWIEEACGGDREIATAAFLRVHPEARFLPPPDWP